MAGTCDFSKCMFEGELRVLWELGQGGHSEVLLVEDSASQQFRAKTASAGSFTVKLLEHEYSIYQHLQCHKKKIVGLPQVFKYGFDHLHEKYVLVMSRLGASMRDVMKLNRAPISEYAALRIGCQLIRRLQYIHGMGVVHGDIKPRNILCGHETFEKVYVVDFGLATFYKNMKSRRHLEMVTGQSFKGTEDFASRSAHKGYSLSCRDDMESLGYTLIYMMRGSLPWSKSVLEECQSWDSIAKNEEVPANSSYKPMEKADAMDMKENMSIETLCTRLPDCISAYMRYVRRLAFDESPDYSLLINKMEERMYQLKTAGGEDNGNELVIWTVPFEKSLFMRVRLEKEVWAELEAKNGGEEEENAVRTVEEGENEGQNEVDVVEQPMQNVENDASCDSIRCLRGLKSRQPSVLNDAEEQSEISAHQPHPVLYRASQKWWTKLLVLFRIRKPIPETVLLHLSDEGVKVEQQEW